MDAEHRRLEEARSNAAPWKKWGPYLSERQWGTVREDYSDNGDAGGDLRRSAAPLLRPGPVERQGSHSQGAAVRPARADAGLEPSHFEVPLSKLAARVSTERGYYNLLSKNLPKICGADRAILG